MKAQWHNIMASIMLTLSENASISPIVKTTTEHGMTGEVIIGNERPMASDMSG